MGVERISVAAVWLGTALAVAGVLLAVPRARVDTALALTLALVVVAGMVAQLAVGRQRGFVARLAATAAGGLVVVLVGAAVALAG